MILTLLLASQCAHADVPDAVTKAQTTKEEISTVESESRDLLGQLYLVQKRVKEISKSRARLTEIMLSSDGDAQSLAQSVAMLEQRLRNEKAQLARRLSLLYRWNSPNLLPFMFSSATAGEFDRNLRYMRIFSERDFAYMRNYQQTLRTARAQRSKLRAKVHVLLSLKKQVQAEENNLASVFHAKTALLSKLRDQKEAGLTELRKIREEHPELETLLRTGFFERRGSLQPPVLGIVESTYGTIVDHDYRFRLLKKGWRYRTAAEGVRSVFSGEVAFAGKLPGYGSAVLIDHGDHYFTVYGWMDHLNVNVGDSVQEGQVIGRASPRLYFEIRHFSDAIDPSQWIKDDKNRKRGIQ